MLIVLHMLRELVATRMLGLTAPTVDEVTLVA